MITPRTIALGLVVAASALAPTAALAKHGADDGMSRVRDDKGGQLNGTSTSGGSKGKRVTGRCTGNASAKLKVKPDGGRLETEFEVDQNRNGVKWTVKLRRNGRLAVKTTATTKAPSGSFSVNRRLTNGPGSDRITARATSPSGQVCTAGLTV